MSQTIKNIIFDFGGVILNLDYRLTVASMAQLSGNDKDIYSQFKQLAFFDDFETGKISKDEFRQNLKKALDCHATDDVLDRAWNAMLLDLPADRVAFIHSLKPRYRTFLFSNTNIIHKEAFDVTISQSVGKDYFDQAFEKTYYSHEVGMRKPHAEVFEFIVDKNALVAEETLFIDDSIQHIEAAQKLGIKTIHLKPPNKLVEIHL